MSTGDLLFQLVSSLRRDEKRQFSKHAAGHRDGPTNYVKLFRSISAMQQYDEEALRAQFEGTKLLQNLPSEKRYLYTTLLKVLRLSRYEQGARNQVLALEEEARILLEKSLYAQSSKRLEKAAKIARNNELLPEMLRILELERSLVQRTRQVTPMRELQDITAEAQSIVDKLSNLNFYRRLYDQIFHLVNADFSNGDEKVRQLDDLLNSERMSAADMALTFEAKRLFYKIRVLEAFSRGDLSAASEHYRNQITLWENSSFMAQEDARPFIGLLYNFAGILIRGAQFDELQAIVQKLERVKTRTADEDFIKAHTLLNVRLQQQMNMIQLEKARELVPAFEELIERYADFFTSGRLMTIYHNLTILHFMSERYDLTLDWMNRILQVKSSDYRLDIVKFAFLLQPVIYFELFDSEMPDNLYRSITRALRKAKVLHDGESELIKKLCDLGKTPLGPLRRERYIEIKDDLDRIYPQSSGSGGPLGIMELRIWLEHKIESKAMSAIYKEWQDPS